MTDLQKQAAEVVGRLTAAQREAVRCAFTSPFDTRPRVAATGSTRRALRERGLGHGDWCYLTPLGLAVRALLQDNPHARDNEEMSDG